MSATLQKTSSGLWPESWKTAATNLCKWYEEYRINAVMGRVGKYLQNNLDVLFGANRPASGFSIQPKREHGNIVYEVPGQFILTISRNNKPLTSDVRNLLDVLEGQKEDPLTIGDYFDGLKIEITRPGESSSSIRYLPHVRTDKCRKVYEHNLETVSHMRKEIMYGEKLPALAPKPVVAAIDHHLH